MKQFSGHCRYSCEINNQRYIVVAESHEDAFLLFQHQHKVNPEFIILEEYVLL